MNEEEVKNTECGENCGCSEKKSKKSCKETIAKLKAEKEETHDKYVRLYAELDTFKRRTNKEREELVDKVKVNMLSSILEIDSDLSIAKKSIKDDEDRKGIELIFNKLKTFLKNHQIEEIQTESYDADLHEVVSIINDKSGEKKIIDVISKGYTINGKPFKYPKIVLSE